MADEWPTNGICAALQHLQTSERPAAGRSTGLPTIGHRRLESSGTRSCISAFSFFFN
jgi:hypothetical protein